MRNTIEEIEQEFWGYASLKDFPLVQEVHVLRKKDLDEFEAKDLLTLIGQKLSLEIVVPMAMVLLREKPLLEAQFYDGDLLNTVLKYGKDFWVEHPETKCELLNLVEARFQTQEFLDLYDFIQELLKKSFEKFKSE